MKLAVFIQETISNTRVQRLTIDGIPCIKVTIGGIVDPAGIERTYDDIDMIFKSDPDTFKVKEERDEHGHFKSFVVTT